MNFGSFRSFFPLSNNNIADFSAKREGASTALDGDVAKSCSNKAEQSASGSYNLKQSAVENAGVTSANLAYADGNASESENPTYASGDTANDLESRENANSEGESRADESRVVESRVVESRVVESRADENQKIANENRPTENQSDGLGFGGFSKEAADFGHFYEPSVKLKSKAEITNEAKADYLKFMARHNRLSKEIDRKCRV